MASHGETMGQEATWSKAAGRRREDRIVGSSASIQEAVGQARTAARTQLPVWIAGPPGCGKRLFARAIHAWSDRRDRPFEVFPCAAISESSQKPALFGDGGGAGPDALAPRAGIAQAGTLVIERAELLAPQARSALLAAVREQPSARPGETAARPLLARIIAVSEPGTAKPWFEDLPHHLIRLQPLSERTEDILPLAAHFLGVFAAEADVTPIGFTPEARTWLISERWSGNVRELRERVRQAVRLAGHGAVSAEALLLAADGAEVPSFKEAKRAFEARYVSGLLRRCNGNISRAARLAKKDRKDFYDVIRRTGVDPQQFRA